MEAVGGSSSFTGGSELLPRLKEATSKDATITDKWNQKGTASARLFLSTFYQAPFLRVYFSSESIWMMMAGRGALY